MTATITETNLVATLDRRAIAGAASWAAKALPKNPAHPTMAGILLRAEGDILTMHAADYDHQVTATVPLTDGQPGTALVPGAIFAQTLAAMRSATVDLIVEGGTLTLTAGRSEVRFQLISGEPTPMATKPDSEGMTVEADILAPAIAALSPLTDPSKADDWQGAIILDGDAGVIQGGDRYHIGRREIRGLPTGRTVIPAMRMAAILGGLTGDLALTVADGLLWLTTETRTVMMRTMDIKLPPPDTFEKIVKPGDSAVTMERAELIEAVKAARMSSDILTVEADDQGGMVRTAAPTSGERKSEMAIEVAAEGHSMTPLKINSKYLIEALGVLLGDAVTIGFTNGKNLFTLGDGSSVVAVQALKGEAGGK